jgi:hypothetical protein
MQPATAPPPNWTPLGNFIWRTLSRLFLTSRLGVLEGEGARSGVDQDSSFAFEIRKIPLVRIIENAAELLPSQGPLEVFVHHNTLHAFEDLPFEQGVLAGGGIYNCEPYLSEDQYRQYLDSGRIRKQDLEAVLIEDLGDGADRLVACFGTRHALRMAMLQYSLRDGTPDELRWIIAATDALRRFRSDLDPALRERFLEESRRWLTVAAFESRSGVSGRVGGANVCDLERTEMGGKRPSFPVASLP